MLLSALLDACKTSVDVMLMLVSSFDRRHTVVNVLFTALVASMSSVSVPQRS